MPSPDPACPPTPNPWLPSTFAGPKRKRNTRIDRSAASTPVPADSGVINNAPTSPDADTPPIATTLRRREDSTTPTHPMVYTSLHFVALLHLFIYRNIALSVPQPLAIAGVKRRCAANRTYCAKQGRKHGLSRSPILHFPPVASDGT